MENNKFVNFREISLFDPDAGVKKPLEYDIYTLNHEICLHEGEYFNLGQLLRARRGEFCVRSRDYKQFVER